MNQGSTPSIFAEFSDSSSSSGNTVIVTAIFSPVTLQQHGLGESPPTSHWGLGHRGHNDEIMGKLLTTHSIVEICSMRLNYAQGYPQQLWVTGGGKV
jgi:hypothetical protein